MSSIRTLVLAAAAAAVLAACGVETQPHQALVVMTQDLGIGADLEAVLAAAPADVPARADTMWAQKDTSSFATRAGAIAAGIASYGPDLVGLQSVMQWSRQAPASGAVSEVASDYLELLLAALAARGAAYDPVALTTTADLEATGAGGDVYRVVERGVILARRGVETSTPTSAAFQAQRTFLLAGAPNATAGGWTVVNAKKGSMSFRFVTTRLEAVDGVVARAQALELAGTFADGSPTIVAGNLGSDPWLPSSPTYRTVVATGSKLSDAAADAGGGFPSCCRDLLCVDPAARLDRRTDFVLTSSQFVPSWGSWVNGNTVGMTSGLWPSPHAGMAAGLFLFE